MNNIRVNFEIDIITVFQWRTAKVFGMVTSLQHCLGSSAWDLLSLKFIALFHPKYKIEPGTGPLPTFDMKLFAAIAIVKKGFMLDIGKGPGYTFNKVLWKKTDDWYYIFHFTLKLHTTSKSTITKHSLSDMPVLLDLPLTFVCWESKIILFYQSNDYCSQSQFF